MYSTDCTATNSVDQASFKLTEILCLCLPSAEIKDMLTLINHLDVPFKKSVSIFFSCRQQIDGFCFEQFSQLWSFYWQTEVGNI